MPAWSRIKGTCPGRSPVSKILDVAPSPAWLASLDQAQRPAFDAAFARLYLKVNEEDLAFPHVEHLASAHPDKARDLAEEFLRVWTRNHGPERPIAIEPTLICLCLGSSGGPRASP